MTSRPPDLRTATIGHIAPFLVYVILLQAEHSFGLPPVVSYAARLTVAAAVLLLVSRPFVTLKPSVPLASVGIGVAVFVIWIGPDLIFGYRHHWLFENRIMGSAGSALSPGLRSDPLLVALRAAGSTVLVPILEELFWRAWMMRWLINPDFRKVPLGQYAPAAFWIVAALFASEHGAYWEVGLAAGIVYNWWMIRTKSLADCILAHGVTNGLLAAYVVLAGQWQYWL